MKPAWSTILLVDGNAESRGRHLALLGPDAGFNIEIEADATAAFDAARRAKPDCVLIDLDGTGGEAGMALCQRLKTDPVLVDAVIVVLTSEKNRQRAFDGLACGVDDYVLEPASDIELVSRVRAALRTRRIRQQLVADRIDLGGSHAALLQSIDHFVGLLAYMIDVTRPGAADRGRQLAESSLRLAKRFQVPPVFTRDLERAALLHEVGLAVEKDAAPGWLTPSGWRSLVVAAHVLSRVEALHSAADLVSAVGENWDGSGFPDRRQRGQIPLRSRLLRVLIDFYAAGGDVGALTPHAGTWYDPAVVAQVEAIMAKAPDSGGGRHKWRVPISALSAGMVLAEDLCTESGVKLLAAGATLTAPTLEVVRRRDLIDPIIDGAWICPAVV